jgi:hypothetical protein
MGFLKKIKKVAQKTFGAVEDATGMDSLGGKIFGSDNKKEKMPDIASAVPAVEDAVNAATVAAQKEAGIQELERKRRLRTASLLNNPESASTTAGSGTLLGG